MLQLSIQDFEGKNTVIPLTEGEFTIGRDESNAICFTERNVSRRHAKITAVNGQVFVQNIEATYGTRFNSLLLRGRTPFQTGDVIQIGDYVLELLGGSTPVKRDTALVDEQEPTPATAPPSNATAIVNLADIQSIIDDDGNGNNSTIPEAEQPRLIVESENLRGLEFRVTRTPLVLGRVKEAADLVVDHRSISKEHARLTRRPDGSWEILDLGSSNGIQVNGEPYSKSALSSGDRLVLGHVTLRFLAAGERAPAVKSTPSKSGGGNRTMLISVLALIVLLAGATVAFLMLSNDNAPSTKKPQIDKVEASPQAVKESSPETESITDTLAKIEKLRSAAMFEDALNAAKRLEKKHSGDADVALMVRKLEIDIGAVQTLDKSKEAIAQDPKAAMDSLRDLGSQLEKDSPLLDRAQKAEEEAKQALISRLLSQGYRALKHRRKSEAADKAEMILALEPDNVKAKALFSHSSRKTRKRAESRTRSKPKAQAAPKPEPKPEPKVEPKPEPKVEPKPEPKPEPEAVVKMSGKDYYKAGRKAVLNGDTKKAVELFNKAVSNGYGRAHSKLASLYFRLGNKAKCAKHGKAYLNRYPDAGDAPQIEGLVEKCR